MNLPVISQMNCFGNCSSGSYNKENVDMIVYITSWQILNEFFTFFPK